MTSGSTDALTQIICANMVHSRRRFKWDLLFFQPFQQSRQAGFVQTIENNIRRANAFTGPDPHRAEAAGLGRLDPRRGTHVFLHDNTFQAVYSTNDLMRVVDVMITKPSELAFYPVPILFNERVGGHEMWGAIRGAEIGNGTVEARSILQTLQAINMLVNYTDLLTMYCDCIVKNKSIGIYDGAYKSVELATGKKFERKKTS